MPQASRMPLGRPSDTFMSFCLAVEPFESVKLLWITRRPKHLLLCVWRKVSGDRVACTKELKEKRARTLGQVERCNIINT